MAGKARSARVKQLEVLSGEGGHGVQVLGGPVQQTMDAFLAKHGPPS